MSKRPKLESRIIGMVEKELETYDENTRFLIMKLLLQVTLDRNKVSSQAANKLEAEINKLYETVILEK